MKWNPFRYQDDSYNLSHLHPFELIVTQPAQGNKPERKYTFEVRFSLHCFTQTVKSEDSPDLRYGDNRETRTFCFYRYKLSFYLPDIIRAIHTKRCLHTGHGNFFFVELLTEDGNVVEYAVFFDVNKPRKNGGPLELYVQTAFVPVNKQKGKKIGFFVIAYNRTVGKPIKEPK